MNPDPAAATERPWTQERLQGLIADQVEESFQLEYKSAGALTKDKREEAHKEIAKDISSLANADGGLLIYGIAEDQKKRFPSHIDPIKRSDYPKERLEDIMTRYIQPKLQGVIIHPVVIDDSVEDVCYVVDVPQSATVHKVKDSHYYRRHNFKVEPMEDYEIREAMNRARHPKLAIKVRLNNNLLEICVTNIGTVIAKDHAIYLTCPRRIKGQPLVPPPGFGKIDYDTRCWTIILPPDPSKVRPIFPKLELIQNVPLQGDHNYNKENLVHELTCRVYADEMPFIERRISLDQLSEEWI